MAPTARDVLAEAGERVEARALSLPAPTTERMPAAVAASTARFRVVEVEKAEFACQIGG